MSDKLPHRLWRWIAGMGLIALSGCGALRPSLEVVNNLDEEICVVRIEGGENLLTDPLAANDSIKVGAEEGTLDVFAATCSGTQIASELVEFGDSGVMTWTLSPQTPSVMLINSTGQGVCWFQVKDHELNNWGINLVEDSPVAEGDSLRLYVPSALQHDLYAKTCDETGYEEYSVEVSGEFTWTLPDD